MKEIKVHLEEDHISKLTSEAQQQNISRSDLIRQKLKPHGYDRTSYARAVEAAARTIPGITIQAADWKDKTAALRQKPPEADIQAERNHPDMIGVTAIKLRGGDIRFVFTKEAFCRLVDRYP